jgi:hypothetical protein
MLHEVFVLAQLKSRFDTETAVINNTVDEAKDFDVVALQPST